MKLEVPDLAEDAAHIRYRLQDERASPAAPCEQPSLPAQPLTDISNRSALAVTAAGEPSHHSRSHPCKSLALAASLDDD